MKVAFGRSHLSQAQGELKLQELDRQFTIHEVYTTLTPVCKYKITDYDNNIAEIFINSKDFILYLVDISNHIYDNGMYRGS